MADGSTDHPPALPDPGVARNLDELVTLLRALKVWAGDPSFETITRRINARWAGEGRPASEHARRGTVVDCFRNGRRRINADLVVAVVQALHDEASYVAHWRQAVRVSLAETYAAGQVRVLDHLPAATDTFIGRTDELKTLHRVAAAGGLCVLTGMAGVGKTQLAIHAGNLLPDFATKLFVNLRGFHPDASQPPAEPAAVLDGFLRLLGVPAQQIPYATEARSALLRDHLEDRRALIILDNAVDEAQVRPLLDLCALTLITSRRRLGIRGSREIDIDVLSAGEAAQLLAQAVPDVPVGADPAAHERVAHRCGKLPLALTVAAGQIAATPGWTITDHADRLDERHRHHRLDDGVHLALHLSYQRLPADRQTLLRRLAAHPGQDLDEHAAAALLDATPDTTATHLRHLVADHLVQQPIGGRFGLHDLVRAYAAERAADEDRPADRRAALTRLFDHYLYGAAAAMDALHPAEKHRRPVLPPHPELPFTDPKAALAWLDAERTTLVAVCLHAARHGWPTHAVRLAATLYTYLDNGGHPADAIAVHSEATHAARSIGDRAGEAGALVNLGVVHWQLGRYPEAINQMIEALSLFRDIGDARGEARALGNLGAVHNKTGDLATSARFHAQALARFIAIDDLVGEANTLTNLGDAYARLGRHDEAAEHNSRALAIFRSLQHRGGEATALTNLGEVHVRQGAYADAAAEHEQAVAIFREIGERYGETCALNGLGEALTGLGEPAQAALSHRTALALAQEIDEPEEQTRAAAALAALDADG